MSEAFLLDLVTVAAFFGICLVVFVVGLGLTRSGKRARSMSDLRKRAAQRPSWFVRSMAGAVPQFGSEVEGIERDLKRAGYYRPHALIEYLWTRNVLVIFVG